jgi:hypothetical protein
MRCAKIEQRSAFADVQLSKKYGRRFLDYQRNQGLSDSIFAQENVLGHREATFLNQTH